MNDLYIEKEKQLFCAAMRAGLGNLLDVTIDDATILAIFPERYDGWLMAKTAMFGDDEIWLTKANAAREGGFVGDPDK